jgi:hypothetical protein
MEAALQCGQLPTLDGQHEAAMTAALTSTATTPLSTGSGKSVELIGALLDSLAALGTNTKRRRRIRGEEDDDAMSSSSAEMDEDENEAADASEALMEGAERQQLDDLLRITDNVATRAATLQSWIWTLLQRVEKANSNGTASSEDPGHLQQVTHLKAKYKTLKAQLKELSRSRDEMFASDKRVRRGLYRLAAGRVQLKEVLKAIVASDEDKEAAAAWMEVTHTPAAVISSSAAAASAAATPSVKAEGGDGEKEEQKVDSAQVAHLTKQAADLEQVAAVRDVQIKKVRSRSQEFFSRVCLSQPELFFVFLLNSVIAHGTQQL